MGGRAFHDPVRVALELPAISKAAARGAGRGTSSTASQFGQPSFLNSLGVARNEHSRHARSFLDAEDMVPAKRKTVIET